MREVPIEKMRSHLKSPDPLTVLLKGHLWIEAALIQALTACLESIDTFPEVNRLSFTSKIALIRATNGFAWPGSFLKLNSIRNRVAHDLGFEITESIVRELYGSFEKDFGEEYEDIDKPKYNKRDSPQENLAFAIVQMYHYVQIVTIEALRLKHAEIKRQLKRMRKWAKKEGIDLGIPQP
jgi:hypothetical protein